MPMKDFTTARAAESFIRKLEKKGVFSASLGFEDYRPAGRLTGPKRRRYTVRWQGGAANPSRRLTKVQRLAAAASRAKKTRLAKAVRGLLKVANPAVKTSGASIVRLKGGAIKITPIKAHANRRGR